MYFKYANNTLYHKRQIICKIHILFLLLKLLTYVHLCIRNVSTKLEFEINWIYIFITIKITYFSTM